MLQFSNQLLEKIDDNHFQKLHESPYKFGLGINVKNDSFNASVYRDDIKLCSVEELTQLIDELIDIRSSIEEESGLMLYDCLS